MADSPIDWDLLSSYAGLLTLAISSIYAGSFGSLPPIKHKTADGVPIDDDEDEEEEVEDRLSSQDAWLFPVIGSVLLFGLYMVVKYIGKEWINFLLQWYFTIAGVGSVGKSCISLVKWTIGPHLWKQFDRNRIVIRKGHKELISVSVRTPSLFLIPLSAVPSILYTFGSSTTRRSALLTDVLALSFSHNALSLLKLDSFKTGCVLLSGLFFYDIWWVFGTEVMVKVATTLDVPIKLLWTKSMTFSTERGFTMLGLGDIVIPGMFVALALRYDNHKFTSSQQNQTLPPGVFKKPYFIAALSAYGLGLGTTMAVMHIFKAAQPALLYLSPACILSFFITSIIRGEFEEAWAWSDEPTEKSDSPASTSNINDNDNIIDTAGKKGLSSSNSELVGNKDTMNNNDNNQNNSKSSSIEVIGSGGGGGGIQNGVVVDDLNLRQLKNFANAN
ncbi:signal peptide peptidase-domain-containing protein [Abortiporus biennis]|nr:signal peptide peptidase-domain-containing protein [Abortiporus biennis]